MGCYKERFRVTRQRVDDRPKFGMNRNLNRVSCFRLAQAKETIFQIAEAQRNPIAASLPGMDQQHDSQMRARSRLMMSDERIYLRLCPGDPNDVGEIRRVLNSVLAFMEEPNSTDSLVLAATNHVEILDEALARRFDEVVEYLLPDPLAGRKIIEKRLGKFKLNTRSWSALAPALAGLSPGELVRAADSMVKDAIIDGATKISADVLRTALHDRQTFKGKFRKGSDL